MIQLKLQYEKRSISTVFQNKHYLLEAIVENDLEQRPSLALLLRDINKLAVSTTRMNYVNYIRTHQPCEIVKFVGLRKYKADWWIANIKLEACIPSVVSEVYFLLIGWSSEKFGTKAALVKADCANLVQQEFETRLNEKINKGYEVISTFDNIILKTGIIELPEIPGLPKIEEQASLAEICFKPIPSTGSAKEEIDIKVSLGTPGEVVSSTGSVMGEEESSPPSESKDILDDDGTLKSHKADRKKKKTPTGEKSVLVKTFMQKRKQTSEW